jgi:uncharacterized membrane protein
MQEHKASEDRIVMLSDGVFAIAITLLVLDIRLPDGLSDDVFNKMLTTDFLTKTAFYVVTFIIIARYWLSHRRLTKVTEHIDKVYLPLNLVFLAFIAFLPAATSIVSEYGHVWTSVVLYIAVLVGCGYTTTLLWAYVLKKPLITSHKFSQLSINLHIFNAATIPTLFLCSLLLLLIPTLTPANLFYSWIAIPIILFILKRILAKKMTEQEISDHEVFNV